MRDQRLDAFPARRQWEGLEDTKIIFVELWLEEVVDEDLCGEPYQVPIFRVQRPVGQDLKESSAGVELATSMKDLVIFRQTQRAKILLLSRLGSQC
jgi:hypothetical protein